MIFSMDSASVLLSHGQAGNGSAHPNFEVSQFLGSVLFQPLERLCRLLIQHSCRVAGPRSFHIPAIAHQRLLLIMCCTHPITCENLSSVCKSLMAALGHYGELYSSVDRDVKSRSIQLRTCPEISIPRPIHHHVVEVHAMGFQLVARCTHHRGRFTGILPLNRCVSSCAAQGRRCQLC